MHSSPILPLPQQPQSVLSVGTFVLYFRFHMYKTPHGVCPSPSDWLHSVWQPLGPSMFLQVAWFHSFLWLSSILACVCVYTPSSLSIHLSVDIYVVSMSAEFLSAPCASFVQQDGPVSMKARYLITYSHNGTLHRYRCAFWKEPRVPLCYVHSPLLGFPGGSDGKKAACNAGDQDLTLESGRSSGEENGNPLQYSSLENSMDRGAWWATVHEITKSRTHLNDYHLLILHFNQPSIWTNVLSGFLILRFHM